MEFIDFKAGDLVRRYHVGDYRNMFDRKQALGVVTKTSKKPPEVVVCWFNDFSISHYTIYAACEKLVLVSSVDNI
tara:strand:+ start:374 stop:598 length:225 start_codon:yes stop_codon:yes gene_type:complete